VLQFDPYIQPDDGPMNGPKHVVVYFTMHSIL
jgi:CTP synthase (UTP-ammonia lyase)